MSAELKEALGRLERFVKHSPVGWWLESRDGQVIVEAARRVAEVEVPLADLQSLLARLSDGAFYTDYDEDWRLVGVLRQHIDALGRLLLPAEEEK